MNNKTFLEHCEQTCFDCGEVNESGNFFKVSDGVVLCDECLEIAKWYYPDVNYGGD